jgi:hypothetical protein
MSSLTLHVVETTFQGTPESRTAHHKTKKLSSLAIRLRCAKSQPAQRKVTF